MDKRKKPNNIVILLFLLYLVGHIPSVEPQGDHNDSRVSELVCELVRDLVRSLASGGSRESSYHTCSLLTDAVSTYALPQLVQHDLCTPSLQAWQVKVGVAESEICCLWLI